MNSETIILHAFAFFSSLTVVLFVIPRLTKLAKRLDFLDYPSALKIHAHPTPLLGGLGVFIAFAIGILVSLLLFSYRFTADMAGVLVGGALVVAFGLVDDKRGLSPSYKLLGQIVAALVFLMVSRNSGILTGSGWDVLILVLWIVGLMNAVNFLDAMDGLCGGVSFILAAAFLVIALFNRQTTSAVLALALMGGLLGFLRYNWTPAKIFLGDAGSMFNGFVLSCLGILFARENASPPSLLVPVIILSYPIFDISFVTLIRLREGRKVYVGDYNNSPRRIANLGMQNTRVVLWIYLFCFLLGSLGVLLYFFFDSPIKMLIAVFVWLFLAIFGVHLQRNFVNIGQKLILILIDVVTINAAFLFFFWVKFHSGLFANQWMIPLSEYTAPAIWITIFWINLFAILGLYEVSGDSKFKEELKGISKAVGVGSAVFLILTLDPSYLFFKSWALLLLYALALIIALTIGRGLIDYLVKRLEFLGLFVRKAVMVGTGRMAADLHKELFRNPDHGYQVIGFVREDHQDSRPDSFVPPAGPILGGIEDLDEIARESKVQDILVVVEPAWNGSLQEVMNSVHNLEVSFKVASELRDLKRGYHTVPLRSGILCRIFPSQMRSWEWLIKRLFDGAVSTALLIVLLPVWTIAALLIRMRFKARALVKHSYVGKMGRELELYRFRVFENPPQGREEDTATEHRLGGLGSFLRSTGLERTPVLLNVLKGEMSLVGPEPLAPATHQNLSNSLPLLPKRLNVKPGLLSLAGIRRRSKEYAEAANDRLRDDLYYMENMSLLLDLKIIVRGLVSLLRR
jgi:UDP-N-acetylmuramyl pentapeptide phosphotransferase/UDP-N-acetylglucosamine-1-phosphate transferase/lipopolysaccharide/colanic/teichoic acid biosynthesis glycosyltransferase